MDTLKIIFDFIMRPDTILYYYVVPGVIALVHKLSTLVGDLRTEAVNRQNAIKNGNFFIAHKSVGDIVMCFVVAAIPVANVFVALFGGLASSVGWFFDWCGKLFSIKLVSDFTPTREQFARKVPQDQADA